MKIEDLYKCLQDDKVMMPRIFSYSEVKKLLRMQKEDNIKQVIKFLNLKLYEQSILSVDEIESLLRSFDEEFEKWVKHQNKRRLSYGWKKKQP